MSPLLLLLPPSVYIYLLILFVIIFYSPSMRLGLRRRCTYVFISTPKLLFFFSFWIYEFIWPFSSSSSSLFISVSFFHSHTLFECKQRNNHRCVFQATKIIIDVRSQWISRSHHVTFDFFPHFKIIYQTPATIAFCLVHRTTTLNFGDRCSSLDLV